MASKSPVMKAIRAKCLDCSCGNPYEVKLCPITSCPLYPYREGRNPHWERTEWTEERREAQKQIYARTIGSKQRESNEKSNTEG